MSGTVPLHQRTEALIILDGFSEELGGEVTEPLDSLMQEARFTFDEKVVAVATKVREFEAYADAASAEAKRMATNAKSAANAAASLSRYLLIQLQLANVEKVTHPRFKIAVRVNPPAFEAQLQAPEKLAELRAALTAPASDDSFDDFDVDVEFSAAASVAVSPDWEQLAVDTVRPAALTLDDIAALEQCVVVTPEQVIPESRAWDKKALLALAKVNPSAVAAVAVFSRGTRLEIK